jgi:hypothetical protein
VSKVVVAGIAIALTAATAVALQQRATRPRFEREIPWATNGVWLRAETHVHTKFSDGGHTVDELVDRAAANGCDVLAITDHSDRELTAATPEYHAAIASARARVPGVTLLAGIEWNVPPGKGDDHAVLLLPPAFDSPTLMSEFKERFDDEAREETSRELTQAAFSWLREKSNGGALPVMFLNHPSRRAADIGAVATQLEWLQTIGRGVFVGVEGAPGHQKAEALGAYSRTLKPDDRWDPAIAPPGAAWDQRLASDSVMWAALATADFHGPSEDYWPCQFSATWVYARDRSADAVLDAFHAGSFAGVHGHIAREVQLTVATEGLPRAAIAGEAIRANTGALLRIELQAIVPGTDWAGAPNKIDVVDLIGITKDGAGILHSGSLQGGALRHELQMPAGGIAIRGRGRRIVEDGPDLLFYTNPITVRSPMP